MKQSYDVSTTGKSTTHNHECGYKLARHAGSSALLSLARFSHMTVTLQVRPNIQWATTTTPQSCKRPLLAVGAHQAFP